MVALLAVRPPKSVTPTQLRRWRTTKVDVRTGVPLTQREAALYYGVSLRHWNRYETGAADIPGLLARVVQADAVPNGFRRDV